LGPGFLAALHEAREAAVLTGGLNVAEVLLEQSGEPRVGFGKMGIEGEGGAQRISSLFVFLHSR